MTLSEISKTLRELEIKPLKRFGQNFIHDPNLCQAIAKDIEKAAHPHKKLLEIGPGLGSLTDKLLERGFDLTAIEIDRGLAQFLRQRYENNPSFRLIEGDALKHLPSPDEKRDEPLYPFIVGNLPYHISTPLLFSWIESEPPPHGLVFMLQKELAQRITANPGTKTYGALSVILQNLYSISVLRQLPSHLFYPQPEVDSTLLGFGQNKLALVVEKRQAFSAFVKKGFSQRRKKLSNLIPTTLDARAEEISPDKWRELFFEVC